MTTFEATADRAGGVLLGLACGDALGVPYEFDRVRLGHGERPAMLGGGLGDFEPGEWSDDTSMAVAVAEGLRAGEDLEERLDAIARRFLDWYRTSPPDVGAQTRAVLATRARPIGITLVDVDPGNLAQIGAANPFGLLLQYPGSTGALRDLSEEIGAAHEVGPDHLRAQQFTHAFAVHLEPCCHIPSYNSHTRGRT